MANWNEDDRDQKQRSYGFIGLSMMAHVGLLAVLAILPNPLQNEVTLAKGNHGNEPVIMELQNSSDEVSPAPTTVEDQASVPVLVAANEAAEVAPAPAPQPMVAEEEVIAQPSEPVVQPAKPVEPKVVVVPPKKIRNRPVPMKEKASAINSDDEKVRDALTAARSQPDEPAPIVATRSVEEPPAEDDAPDLIQEQEKQALSSAAATAAVVTQETEPPAQAAESVQPVEPAQIKAEPTATKEAEAIAAKEPTQSQPQAAAPAPPIARRVETNRVAPVGSNAATAAPTTASNGPAGSSRPGAAPGTPAGLIIRDARELIPQAGNPSPIYPMEDRLRGREGSNSILARVQADGTIAEVILEKSSGSPYMDRAAAEAFKKWKFKPGQAGWIRKPFTFALTGNAQEIPARLRRR